MAQLSIVATLVVKDSYREELVTLFHYLVDETRKEEGNIAYDLNLDIKNSNKFVFIEKWASQQAVEKHNQSKHFLAFLKEIEGKFDSFDVDIITPIY